MPIYEFFCEQCNVIFNFYSSRVNTSAFPACPKCGKEKLTRQLSTFARIGSAKEETDGMLGGLDETKMERAFESLMREAEGMNQDDPRQMAQLMRKFTSQTGISLGDAMDEAISRMEGGEDPEQVEKEMGDTLGDDDISLEAMKKKAMRLAAKRPIHDETLYEL
jgi:putative FmdB family regulatory protein